MALRGVILDVASTTAGVGTVVETLKWGQPSYLTIGPKSGTTIRLGPHDEGYAFFVPCQTTLVETYRVSFGEKLRFEGNRAVVFRLGRKPPRKIVAACVKAALLYHRR
ncbi:MAG: DUF1801 domain-containing protein [Sandaracinus sp.]|nr:DUF1801 domain-containing protein [Sandaracinus sp.]MCB9633852.1 DUF1801 domain-containing protein [Sandaracinus sp.]